MPGRKNEIGNTYGRLCVLALAKSKHKGARWSCQCSCGNITIVKGIDLRRKHVKSCGCLQKEIASQNKFGRNINYIDGRSNHPLYKTYCGMLERCYNRKSEAYKWYGALGIMVCNEWLNNFWQFVTDMGFKPEGMSIERINTFGNYEPSNCKWATITEQNRNQRRHYK